MKLYFLTQSSPESDCIKELTERIHLAGGNIQFCLTKGNAYGYALSFEGQAELKDTTKISGAPRKKFYTEDGETINCGMVHLLKQKGYSDAAVADMLGVSESTVIRRRKEHTERGEFYADSETAF